MNVKRATPPWCTFQKQWFISSCPVCTMAMSLFITTCATFRVILTECTQTQGLTRSWNHCTDSQCVDEIRPLSVPFLFRTSGRSGSTRSDEIQISQIRRIIASSNIHVLPCLDISHKSNIFKLCYHPIVRLFVATIYIYNLYRFWIWDWNALGVQPTCIFDFATGSIRLTLFKKGIISCKMWNFLEGVDQHVYQRC